MYVRHKKIRPRRKELGYTLEEAQFLSGVDRATWMRLEKGETKRASVSTIRRIEDALELEKGELMD
jgi:transcriptional regulator with XRE-family HTH domain